MKKMEEKKIAEALHEMFSVKEMVLFVTAKYQKEKELEYCVTSFGMYDKGECIALTHPIIVEDIKGGKNSCILSLSAYSLSIFRYNPDKYIFEEVRELFFNRYSSQVNFMVALTGTLDDIFTETRRCF